MNTHDASQVGDPKKIRRRISSCDFDRHIGGRIRERRIMLGMTLYALADQINLTYQQASKLERGANRAAPIHLHNLTRVLGVEVGYFFEGVDDWSPPKPTPHQRMMLELARNFIGIPISKHKESILYLTRALNDG